MNARSGSSNTSWMNVRNLRVGYWISSSLMRFLSFSALRPCKMRLKPLDASSCAKPNPIPSEAPVIRAQDEVFGGW